MEIATINLERKFYDPTSSIDTTRHTLPHWHQAGVFAFITWRLVDALPAEVVSRIRYERRNWLQRHPLPWDLAGAREYNRLFVQRVEAQLDSGHGSCILRGPKAANIVADALRYFDHERYDLDCFVVMPNHVHLLVRLKDEPKLSGLVHSWKSFTANELRGMIETPGRVWQRSYWDRLIRDEKHLESCRKYIADNPAKAGLSPSEFSIFVDSTV